MKQNTFIMAIMLSASILVAGCTDKRYPVTIPVSADITAAVYAAPDFVNAYPKNHPRIEGRCVDVVS